MRRSTQEKLRLLVIASTVASAAAVLLLGIPRARIFMTPRLERVLLVSAALGDPVASAGAREVLVGSPVTLYALIEARPRGGDATVLYGTVDRVQLPGEAEPRPVQPWSDWWLAPEFLWFKVEPAYPFANPEFDPAFTAQQIEFVDNYQVTWGFGWSHAVDIDPGGDAYPEWDTGTMRFAARVVLRDTRDRILQRAVSPGGDAVHAGAITDRPLRVTVIAGDDPFGRVGGYAGLPYVPTSGVVTLEQHATALYLGGTVLDYWVMALRSAGLWQGALFGWQELPQHGELVVADMFLANDGTYYYTDDPLRPVRWGEVKAGDVLAIDDHVGILYEDRGPGGGGDGMLNRWDRLIEAYFEPLRETDLGEAFVSDIAVYRLQPDP